MEDDFTLLRRPKVRDEDKGNARIDHINSAENQQSSTSSRPTSATYGLSMQRPTRDVRFEYRESTQLPSTSSAQQVASTGFRVKGSMSSSWRRPDKEQGYQRNRQSLSKPSSAGGPPTKKIFHVSFKYLEQLMNNSDEEFATRLSSQHAGLSALMRTELSQDLMVLLVRVIRRAANSLLDRSRVVILQAALVDDFIKNVERYVGMLLLQDQEQKKFNKYFWNSPDDFWTDLIEICSVTLNIMPTLAALVVPRILNVMKMYVPSIETQHNLTVSDEVKSRLEALLKAVEESKKKVKDDGRKVSEEFLPPNDFRTINVLPSPSEVLNDKNFLRKNVIKGGYASVDHYLDVQFRLLREDFVRPLRKGIQSYFTDPTKRLENVKVYKNVRFLCVETENKNYCMRIKFRWNNLEKLKSVGFENSKRFMFGSLLCFTKDNFKTIFFGRVMSQMNEDLEKGELIVGFDESFEMLNDLQTDFVMIECSVYFEPYYHVLNAMKRVKEDEFPMAKYIVFVNPIVDKPLYLESKTRCAAQGNLENLWGQDVAETKLYLNGNQLEAYNAALMQEFVIIQGPPGTGKTYLGLEIAKTLIRNKRLWDKIDDAPMLVVCYTNHALDQFLEGLITITDGNIARIGGQSSNETLKKYNLKELRRFDGTSSDMRRALKHIMHNIKQATELLNVLQNLNGILPFKVMDLFSVIPSTSWLAKATRSDFLNWLFQENDKKVFKRKGEKSVNITLDTKFDESNTSDEETKRWNRLYKRPIYLDIAYISDEIITTEKIDTCIIEVLGKELDQFLKSNPDETKVALKTAAVTQEIRKWRNRSLYLQAKLEQVRREHLRPVKLPNVDWNDPWALTFANRWNLYLFVLQSTRMKLPGFIDELNKEFRKVYAAYEEIQNVADVRIMRDQLVIGMTTTGAARKRKYLEMLKCPIVIVEEAAEVLEAHIVASITAHCEHLILIGDHQQLQPSTADYEVKTKYGLGVSLFERMVNNNFKCHTLNVQHRMRPEISELVRESVYDHLEDHESVLDRPQVAGMDRCLYFIDHKEDEQSLEGTSKKNVHEAEFLVALAKYLVLNGHNAEKITILAAYLSQMFEIDNKIKTHGDLLKGCKVTALDNYQGEENDLVLLSLVRSNPEKKIGFLAEKNRVCVALSRARTGFYVIGNMSQLCHESHRGHDLWSKIKAKFRQQDAIGSSLSLRCQTHNVVTIVKSADDFLQVPEGGCSKMCEATLKCGHNCQSVCHASDSKHEEYSCRKPCLKKLCDKDDTHLCKKLCNETCGPCRYPVLTKLDCGHELEVECYIGKDKFKCPVFVTAKLPCDHTVDNKPCHQDPLTFSCPHPCDTIVEPCGHACRLECHIHQDPDHLKYKCKKNCAKYMEGCIVKTDEHLCPLLCYQECPPCNILMLKKRTICSHAFKVPCHEDVDELLCEKPCKKVLSCGHKCDMTCGEDCGLCCVKVEKKIELCGHSQKVECHATPDRTKCRSKCPLELPCGHPCTKRCNEHCTDKCTEKTTLANEIVGACGHNIKEIDCHQSQKSLDADDPDLLKHCTEPCGVILKCGHACTGNCSECFQGRFHKRCSSKCGVPLVCNHLCQNTCREACRSCTEPCPFRCTHSRCKKLCGEVCTPCKEPCPRRCPHIRCTNFCGQPCKVSPCEEPCKRFLECGHQCAGFCGDPCLSKCKKCHPEFFELFFGFEDEPEARFVQLQDCQHVVENSGMLQWLEQASMEIAFKVCPMCKVPIKTTYRYSDFVKSAALDVVEVKTKLAGTPKENFAAANVWIEKVDGLIRRKFRMVNKDDPIKKVLALLRVRLDPVRDGKRQFIDKVQVNAVISKLQLIQRLIEAVSGKIEEDKIEDPSLDPRHNMFGNWNCARSRQLYDSITSKPEHKKYIGAIIDVITRDENYITDQEIDDVSREIDRLSKLISFSMIDRSNNRSKITPEVEEMLKRGEILSYAPKVYTKEEDKEFAEILDKLKMVFPITVISLAEKQEIVKAMGFTKGHWYKCPNGHVYAIGECGGAMEKSRCNECKAEIGGTSHRLLASNSLATEMDGAKHPAYSEMANNLLNYWNIRDII